MSYNKVEILYIPSDELPSLKTYSKKKSNDPSAGSPTDTLLRLLLPLNDTI